MVGAVAAATPPSRNAVRLRGSTGRRSARGQPYRRREAPRWALPPCGKDPPHAGDWTGRKPLRACRGAEQGPVGGDAATGESTGETLCLASDHRAYHRQEGEQHARRDDAAKARMRQALPPHAHAPQYAHCVEDIGLEPHDRCRSIHLGGKRRALPASNSVDVTCPSPCTCAGTGPA